MRISVPNPDRVLRPGLFVRVIVAAFENPNAIRIPQQAVQELQGLKSVYVVGADDKAEARQIVASYRIGNDWVVDSGLTAGDRVVIEGVGKLRPGAPVKPVAAARRQRCRCAPRQRPRSRRRCFRHRSRLQTRSRKSSRPNHAQLLHRASGLLDRHCAAHDSGGCTGRARTFRLPSTRRSFRRRSR